MNQVAMQSKHFFKMPGILKINFSQCARFYILERANSIVAAQHKS